MKLTVLGGAAACPNPGQGSSSYLLEVQGQRWLLDCGPGAVLELRKHVEINQIDRILISHVHADHTLDLVPLRYGLKYAPGLAPSRPILHMPPEGLDYLVRVSKAFAMGQEGADRFFSEVFELTEYNPEQVLRLGAIHVAFLRTAHPVPCWAMRISTPGGTLVYLADTGPQEDLVEFARRADILICEGSYPDHQEIADVSNRPHLSAYEAGVIARESGARKFILTHLWSTGGFDRYREQAARGFGRPVSIAVPGLTVTAI